MLEGKKPFVSPYKKQIIQIAQMAHYQPIASIHPPSNKFNYTILKSNILKKKQNSMSQPKINEDTIQENKRYGYRKIMPMRLPKLIKQAKMIKSQTPSNGKFLTVDTRIDTKITSEGQEEIKKQVNSRHLAISHSPSHLRKEIQRSYPALNCPQSSQSESQYIKDATPGPGYYPLDSASFCKKKQKTTSGNFGGNSKRFPDIEKQITKSFIQKQTKSPYKKIKENKISFNSKIERFQKLSKQVRLSPGPHDYSPRIGIQEDLIRKIQRNFMGSFGVAEKRFTPLKQIDPLGPGRYNPQVIQQQFIHQSHFFQSKIPRFKQQQ